jgi:AraC-like DNA-binding protein
MGNVVGLGTTTFIEKIKFYTGFAPLQYLINLRVAEAMCMIKNSDYSMTRIALELGFYSSQHFFSTFKKMTGFSPKSYRKNRF